MMETASMSEPSMATIRSSSVLIALLPLLIDPPIHRIEHQWNTQDGRQQAERRKVWPRVRLTECMETCLNWIFSVLNMKVEGSKSIRLPTFSIGGLGRRLCTIVCTLSGDTNTNISSSS
jgi:hypothetical protein